MLNYFSTLPMWMQEVGFFSALFCGVSFVVAIIYIMVHKLRKVKIGAIEAELEEDEEKEAVE